MTTPRMLCYSATPNDYITAHASEIAELYDGFIYPVHSWDEGVTNLIGLPGKPAKNPDWMPKVAENIAALRAAGAGASLLDASFGTEHPWPSAETLLSEMFTEKFRRHFSALARAARETGFAGVCIDTEYCYKRYVLDHEIYTYDGYTPGELRAASHTQGRAVLAGVLNEFPDAVVMVIPGSLRVTKALERDFILGFLAEMADRDAPGGMHMGTEYAYCLHDRVTQAAIARVEDCGIGQIADAKSLDYWRRRCTVAPGVWPFHMAETGGENYPVRPWKEEMTELKEQMDILRRTSKKMMWSFTSHAAWLPANPAVKDAYGIRIPEFDGGREATDCWHNILRDWTTNHDPRMNRLFDAVAKYDAGEIDAGALCDAFGTPDSWWMLGLVGNPHTAPSRVAAEALTRPIRTHDVYYGRDGAVRWFHWSPNDPRGVFAIRESFDCIGHDDAAAHLVTWIESDKEHEAYLQIGWDDGLLVRLGGELVFDKATYGPQGHGALYRDRYQFEETIRVTLPAGRTKLAATSINLRDVWQFELRVTDGDGYPIEGVTFSTEVPE